MKRKLVAAAFGVAILVLGSSAPAQDAPAREAPWFLKFSHEPLETITVPFRDGSAKTFYVMAFKVANKGKVEARLSLRLNALVFSGRKTREKHLSMPSEAAEDYVRRLSNSPKSLNVQQINKKGSLKPGESVKGVAVFGEFNREWHTAQVTVSGLEPRTIHARVRQYGNGFTLPHRAYHDHNTKVQKGAETEDKGKNKFAIVSHDVLWAMDYSRAGDEFAPQLDDISLIWEGWKVSGDPAPKIVLEKKPTFGGDES